MRVTLSILIVGLLASGSQASTFLIGNGKPAPDTRDGTVTQQTGVTTETFGSGHVATDTTPTSTSGCGIVHTSVLTITGDFLIGAGNTKNRRKTPTGDTSCYISMSNVTETGTTDIAFTVPVGEYIDYISYYWGSIDPYNYVQFRDAASAPIASNLATSGNGYEANGQQITDLNSGNAFASLLVEATFSAAEGVRSIHIRNTNWATEIDNLSWRFATIPPVVTSAVRTNLPVDAPGSLGIAGLGLGLLALARQRGRRAGPAMG